MMIEMDFGLALLKEDKLFGTRMSFLEQFDFCISVKSVGFFMLITADFTL